MRTKALPALTLQLMPETRYNLLNRTRTVLTDQERNPAVRAGKRSALFYCLDIISAGSKVVNKNIGDGENFQVSRV